MHRYDESTGRGRHAPRGRDDEQWEDRGWDARSDDERGRSEEHDRGRRITSMRPRTEDSQEPDFDEGRRFGGRGEYDRDRDYLDRGGHGGYGGYGGSGEAPGERGTGGRDTSRREHEHAEERGPARGHDEPQGHGTRSVGFRGRMGEDYGYGGFGHMGQSDLYGDRHMRREDDPRGLVGRGMDRGYGDTDRGYHSDRYAHDRPSGAPRGYGGMAHEYGSRTTQGGVVGPPGRGDVGPSSGVRAPMRGKGPKNYVRSDERIREDVCELLEDADLDASDIEVRVRSCEVILEGTVDDRWAKREAEDIAGQARGVKDVHNQLKIRARDQPGPQAHAQHSAQPSSPPRSPDGSSGRPRSSRSS